MKFLNFVRDREIFFFFGAEDHIRILQSPHLLVRGNYDDVKLVDIVELGRFGLGRASHT